MNQPNFFLHKFSSSRRLHLFSLVTLAASLFLQFGLPANVVRAASSPTFIRVEGDQFTLNGTPVVLKGANYYQRNAPWAEMWKQWYGPQVAGEVQAGKDQLGLNTLRIMVPYGQAHGWNSDATGAVSPDMLDRLRQMVQIAGQNGQRVIVTLFDFYNIWPAAGSQEEAANLRYLAEIVGAFREDDRVLAWDIHNEPDNYTHWTNDKRPDQVIDWLSRMLAATKRLDSNHPLTVGLGHYQNFWFSPTPGQTPLIDLVDFVSFHAYEAPNLLAQVQEIKGRTTKPVLLEETGWPTYPAYTHPTYNEDDQYWFYERMIVVARSEKLVGAVQWVLWDFTAGKSLRPTDQGDWMGLFRWDGSLKPAGKLYATWPVPDLPSATTSDLPLTGAPLAPEDTPLYFPQTNHFVAAQFKQLWQQQGGLEQIGLPLTEAFVEKDRTIQIFERGIMELWTEARGEPGFYSLSPQEQLTRVVKLRLLGSQLAAGRSFPKTAPFTSNAQRSYFPETGHSLSNGFLDYWQSHGGLLQFGFPISEEFDEVSATDGQVHTVQYFERARFEYHPENRGTPYEVELGQLGREEMKRRGWLS